MATGLHNTLVLFPLYWKDVCIVFVFSQSGYNESLLKAKRHQLHESPRGLTPVLDTDLDRNFALHWVETFYFVFLNAKHQELYGCIYEYIVLQYIYIWISLAHLLQGLRGFAGASLLQVQPVVVYEREESQENMQGKAEVERGNLGKTCWPMLPGNLGDSRKRKATWGYNLSLHKTRTSKNTVEINIYICGSKPVLKVTDQLLQNMLTTFTNGCLAQTNVLLILFLCHCQLHHKFWTKPAWKFEA